MGTGDDVPRALDELGVTPHFLSGSDLANADLSRYSAIVIGIRAYSNRPDLIANNARLLNYVHNGGTLIVQYQSAPFDNYGPYPFTLGRNPESRGGIRSRHSDRPEQSALSMAQPHHLRRL